ncbi:MAG: OadG family protein [Candidatus Cloacimonetes bacterium]|jgi:Na+-transporting methylmalonyl-CoA/oxaloacetate decarboxylase gamma subunit/biotin operon repressor|nr:OadG family protein [Candidatus Cloacimonadota bacterium]MDD4156473.1 OadG family protein [Candidatus Cloacimonadota bacterium]
MKKKSLLVLLLIVISVVYVFADENKDNNLVLREKYGITDNLSLETVAETIGISVEDIKNHFHLSVSDIKLNKQSLKTLGISIFNLQQYYYLKNVGYNDYNTLESICLLKNIPIKKMSEYLNINPQDSSNRSKTLIDLGINVPIFEELEERFDENILDFSSTLTVLGMSVVFLSLIITSLLISQLVHLNKKKDKKETKATLTSPIGKISTQYIENLSSDAVIAVIAAIHKHRIDTDEQNRIMLTWRRANVSMWQASGKVQMPNSSFRTLKNNR